MCVFPVPGRWLDQWAPNQSLLNDKEEKGIAMAHILGKSIDSKTA